MRERSHRKKAGENTVISRISLLFFYSFFLGGLLWAENFAFYRRNYVFYQYTPYLFPCLALGALGLFIWLALRYTYQGDPRKDKVFSRGFNLYLLAGATAAFLIPWLASLLFEKNAFMRGVDIVAWGLIPYFLGYLLWKKIKPSATLLLWLSAADAILLDLFYSDYLSGHRFFIDTKNALTLWGAAIVFGGVALLLLGGALVLCRSKRYRIKPIALIFPAALSLVLIFGSAIFDAKLSSQTLRYIIYGGIGLDALWALIGCILIKLKKL